jgi:hypothetical protein
MIKPKNMRLAGHVTRMGRRGLHTRSLVGKPEGKKQLRRSISRWEDYITVDVTEI